MLQGHKVCKPFGQSDNQEKTMFGLVYEFVRNIHNNSICKTSENLKM